MNEYFLIVLTILISSLIAIVLFLISYLLINKNYDLEKIAPYECGFDPFDDARSTFEIRFYLVALLFIIFDLEIIYLFPWAVTLKQLDLFGFSVMFLFLIILTVGFGYEWLKGALEWE